LDKKSAVTLVYQYPHDLYWRRSGNGSTENSDVWLANYEHKFEEGTLTVGRQRIAMGDGRLIAAPDWGNLSPTFDAIRYKTPKWEVWGGKLGVFSVGKKYARVAAAATKGSYGETTLVYKHDERSAGDIDVFTLDHLYSRNLGWADFKVEASLQSGHSLGKKLGAWAGHASLTRAVAKDLKVFVAGDVASGGSGPNYTATFDQLYPTNHFWMGISDLVGRRNITQLVVGANYKTPQGIVLDFWWRKFGLYNSRDAWYAANGSVNRSATGTFVDPTGQAGRDIGSEWDLTAGYNFDKRHGVQVGISIFEPGRFIRRLNGGSAKEQVWGFLQYAWKY
jgi:hypothetical protein